MRRIVIVAALFMLASCGGAPTKPDASICSKRWPTDTVTLNGQPRVVRCRQAIHNDGARNVR